jgi:hypothetical protein
MIQLEGVIHWGKLPVPYVAAWSSEDTLSIRKDPLIGGRLALFRNGRRGLIRPMFGQMDESRVRRVVTQRLCQICAQPWKREAYVLDTMFGRTGKQGERPILNEPPSCLKCFDVALALCPGIRRQLDKPKVLFARVRSYEVVVSEVRYVEGGTPDLNAVMKDYKGPPVIGSARPALIDYDVLPIGDLRARLSPLPANDEEDDSE